MAAGDRFFGYQPDPNLASPLASFTDNTRVDAAGSSNGVFKTLQRTTDMPDGLYKYRLDFQIYNNGGTNKHIYIDAGTEGGSIGYIWSANLDLGQVASREGIIKVDKGVGHEIGINYPNGWYGLLVTFQYIGALT